MKTVGTGSHEETVGSSSIVYLLFMPPVAAVTFTPTSVTSYTSSGVSEESIGSASSSYGSKL